MTEKEFNPKAHFEWFDKTRRMIEETPRSNLGWINADLTVLQAIVQTKGAGGDLKLDSMLADRFNRDGTLKDSS